MKRLTLLLTNDDGQGVLEYVMLLGTAAVLIVAALIAGFILITPQVLGSSCPTVDPLAPAGQSCVTK
jgi:hypothetical protein